MQSTVIFSGTRSYWLGAGMQLISLAGKHWLVISVIVLWSWLWLVPLQRVEESGESHDLNCPITIVVRLYLGGLLYKECVNRDSNDCLVDRGRL